MSGARLAQDYTEIVVDNLGSKEEDLHGDTSYKDQLNWQPARSVKI
jgi:hypothetical protein